MTPEDAAVLLEDLATRLRSGRAELTMLDMYRAQSTRAGNVITLEPFPRVVSLHAWDLGPEPPEIQTVGPALGGS